MFCEHTNIICTVWNSGDKAPLLRQCQQQNNPRFCLNSFPFLLFFFTFLPISHGDCRGHQGDGGFAAPSMNQFESASIKLLSSLVLVYSVFIFVCVQFELYIFTTSSQCLYTKYPLTTWVPHLGSFTRTRSNSNCRSSASLARRSIQKPEQHCHESSWLELPLALPTKYIF